MCRLKQAQWALFSTWFNFTMAYKDKEADSLSQIHPSDKESGPEPETILPKSYWINAILRELTASGNKHTSRVYLTNPLFVLIHLRSKLISWAHSTAASRHYVKGVGVSWH